MVQTAPHTVHAPYLSSCHQHQDIGTIKGRDTGSPSKGRHRNHKHLVFNSKTLWQARCCASCIDFFCQLDVSWLHPQESNLHFSCFFPPWLGWWWHHNSRWANFEEVLLSPHGYQNNWYQMIKEVSLSCWGRDYNTHNAVQCQLLIHFIDMWLIDWSIRMTNENKKKSNAVEATF